MFTVLPPLSPMRYQLWLPRLGLYVRETDALNYQFIGTANCERAAVLPEPEARQLAVQLIRSRRCVVELRPAQGAQP